MEQKFKRGNLVRCISEHPVNKNYFGREAVVKGSYNEMYGNGEPKEKNSYSIVFMDDGNSLAWKSDNDLELINEGGEHLFAEAKANREKTSKEATDLKRIKETWAEKTMRQSSETMLFLFEKIGHRSSFLRNGEFFMLNSDWFRLYPLLHTIMTAKTEDEVNGLLDEYYHNGFREKSIALFHEIQTL